MKKIISILLASFLALNFTASVTFASAVSGAAVFAFLKDVALDEVLNFGKNIISGCSDSISKRTEAARLYYFYKILKDDYSSGKSVFDETGNKFSNDILDFYYHEYILALNNVDVYDSNGDIFIQSAGYPDTPFSLRLLAFHSSTGFAWLGSGSTKSQSEYEKDCFNAYYQSMLARYILEHNEQATDPAPGKSGLEIAPAYVSSDELVEGLERDNKMFYPKDYKAQITYRTDEYFQKYCNFPDKARKDTYKPYIMDNARFVGTGDAEKLYFILYYNEDGLKYYSEYQFCLYFKVEVEYDESGSAVGVKKMPCLKYWSAIDGSEDEATVFYESYSDCSELKYFFIDLHYSSSYFRLVGSKTFTDFLKGVNCTTFSKAYFTNTLDTLYIPDLSQSEEYVTAIDGRSSHKFCGNYINHDSDCRYNANCDIGLLVDSKPIAFTWRDIDISKIGKGQVVTINGDTIYNYTITNPETGDSSKFGDYITNNYTYITNNNGGSLGGSVGGDVTVGGKIDVGGSVAVDVNVNVNGAGDSGNVNPGDFTSGDNVDLTKYYDNAVEQSTGFQKFLKVFFDFLPPELLALLLFAVSMAIVCRVFGR